MPRLAVNRKDTSGELIGGQKGLIRSNNRRFHVTLPDNARSMAVSWPVATPMETYRSRKRGHIAS
jgi:hypothetical protein